MALQKLRTAMVRPGRDRLKGEVEVDEVWLGGVGDTRKKYLENKRFVLTSVEKNGRKIGRIRMKLISETGGHALLAGIQEMVEPGSLVVTDGWQSYMCITKHGYQHRRVIMPDKRKDLRDQDLLPGVHRVAALFKRWVLGTYQGKIDTKHLPRYLDEFVFRFNRRTSESRGLLFYRLLQNAVQAKAVPYSVLTQDRNPYI
jgi:transposase-like protein